MAQVRSIALLVLMIGGALVLLSVLPWRRGSTRRAFGLVVAAVYAYGNLSHTILGRSPKVTGSGGFVNLDLFWSYRRSLTFAGGRPHVANTGLFAQILLNYLLYVPFGCLLPFVWSERFYRCGLLRGLRRVMLTALACASVTELLQAVLRIGLFELDDLFGNVMGAALGYLLYRALMRVATLLFVAEPPGEHALSGDGVVASRQEGAEGRRGKHFA